MGQDHVFRPYRAAAATVKTQGDSDIVPANMADRRRATARATKAAAVLGRRFRTARKRARLTQTQLAKQIQEGYDPSTISNIETGKTLIRIEALADAANALNVSTDYLLGRTDNPMTADGLTNRAQAFQVDDPRLADALGAITLHYEQLNAYGRQAFLAELRHHFPTLTWSGIAHGRNAGSSVGA